MAGASVFVLPSIVAPDGQMEGIPVALMEAMACERPVIASSLSGIGELIDDGLNGLLVPPGDVEALTDAVVLLAEKPNLAAYMGRRGRRKILAEFQLRDCVSDLLRLIDRFRPPVAEDAERTLTSSLELPREGRLGLRALHDGRDSRVWELALSTGTAVEELVCKIHKSRPGESRPAAERAQREFAILSRLDALRPVSNQPGLCGVPRPIRLNREQAAVVMEACPGTPLGLLLRRARLHPSSSLHGPSEMGVRRAAWWLRTFQARTRRLGQGEEVLDELLHRATVDLQRCIVSGLIDSEARRIRERLGAARDGASLDLSFLCLHHGDFWPGNIVIDGDETRVIDFEGWREGLPLEDVAYFTLQLELFFPFPLLRKPARRYTAAFLETYTGGEPLNAALYRLCRITKALQILSHECERSGSTSFADRRRSRMLLETCLYD
jgi:aminoglycoside phosphotransferase (APT) family kinase protein